MGVRGAMAVVLFTVLAGCAGATDGAEGDGDPAGGVSPTTGMLRGVVVDEAIRPVVGANVSLAGAAERLGTTAADGTFAFGGLPAGSYVVTVSKLGFLAAQQAAVVVAGDREPELLRVQMTTDIATRAYSTSIAVEGFIECGTPLVACQQVQFFAGNVTSDRSRFTLSLSGGAKLVQTELVWESTQAVAPHLAYGLDAFAPGCNEENYWVLNRTQGESPLLLKVNETLVAEQGVGGTCPLTTLVSASGPNCTPAYPGPPASVASICPGLAVEQRFTLYLHAFYNYLPPVEWRFTDDPHVPDPPALVTDGA